MSFTNADSGVPATGSKRGPLLIDVSLFEKGVRYSTVEWMGQRARLKTSDILSIDASPRPLPTTGLGAAVRLSISPDATLIVTKHLKPFEVLSELPLSLRNPSEPILWDEVHTRSEQAWLEKRGLLDTKRVTASATTDYTATQSAQSTAIKTTTDGGDSVVDNTTTDQMGNDDNQPDGVSNDDAGDDDDDDDDDDA